MRRSLIAAAIVAATVTLAYSQQPAKPQSTKQVELFLNSRLGTTSIEAYPQFADGKLDACVVEFNSIARDYMYRQGGFMKIGGSFGLMTAKGNVAVTLKIIVHDIELSTGTFTPSAPANGYFVFGNGTSISSQVAKYTSDTPGAIFAIFKIEPTFAQLAAAIDTGQVTFAFNRKSGGADVKVPLDLTVKDTDENGQKTFSRQMVLDFYRCNSDLLKSLK
jgi:hypothetical protein